jgi:hypothetical protein
MARLSVLVAELADAGEHLSPASTKPHTCRWKRALVAVSLNRDSREGSNNGACLAPAHYFIALYKCARCGEYNILPAISEMT